MSYLVLARKYRPITFTDVVAQEHVTTTLVNAVSTNKLSHAYLFAGPRGTGKTTTARILAKALNCINGPTPTPCNICSVCQEISGGQSLDVIEIDGASNNSVDDIRSLRENIRYSPAGGKSRVYIIDEVHMLTDSAFNALLKTLEEPPAHAIFIFATTHPHEVPATVSSRCQRFDFRRIPFESLVNSLGEVALKENLSVSGDALALIAKKAEGSLRDGLSLLDQITAFAGDTITRIEVERSLGLIAGDVLFALTEALKARDEKRALNIFEQLSESGADLKQFLDEFLEHLRNLVVARTAGDTAELFALSEEERKRYLEAAGGFDQGELLRMIQSVSTLKTNFERVSQPRIFLELELLKLARLERTVDLSKLLEVLKSAPPGASDRIEIKSDLPLEDSSTIPGANNASRKAESVTGIAPTEIPPVPARFTSSLETPDLAPMPESTEKSVKDANSPLTLDEVIQKWGECLEKLRAEKPAINAILTEAKPVSVAGNSITIELPNGQQIHLKILERRENIQALEQVLSETLQLPVRVKLLLSARATSAVDSRDKRWTHPGVTELLERNPSVKALIQRFGAEFVDRRVLPGNPAPRKDKTL